MKKVIIAAAVAMLASNGAFAAKSSCQAQAAEKKLSGAAKTSFLDKCERDLRTAAHKACAAQAAEKQLTRTEKRNFTRKCMSDTLAATPTK